ncbi:MAG: hypothetical protein CVT65_13925 [Actinobacteria bacterium HGW-Actinobacteria-5]|jgi:hypothetical protein|nr:MAG: hypothetical protein CVT65_13925 [Actinobacteria bacterium HGW-Actinobacteria-5]
MEDIGIAKGAQQSVRNLLSSPGTDLISTPTERLDSPYRERVLQVQIFTLADAVAQLARAVEELQMRQSGRRLER